MNQERLLGDEFEPSDVRILDAVHILQNFDRRPMIPNFPDQVREKDQKRYQRSKPDPSAAQQSALLSHNQRQEERQSKHEHRVLIQDANPGHQPKG